MPLGVAAAAATAPIDDTPRATAAAIAVVRPDQRRAWGAPGSTGSECMAGGSEIMAGDSELMAGSAATGSPPKGGNAPAAASTSA